MQKTDTPPYKLTAELSLTLPPLEIEWLRDEKELRGRPVDAELRISFESQAYTFLAEYKAGWDQRNFRVALESIERAAAAGRGEKGERRYPLVILPYLSEEHLNELAQRQVSGLDLCGNGAVIVPKRWFILRTGKPNRFRIEQALRNPYQGRASFVARMLLRRAAFRRLEDLYTEIGRRGGTLSLSLASRALQRLDEDLITMPQAGNRVCLIQPEKLLDRLLREYKPPRLNEKWKGRIALPTAEFMPALFQTAAREGQRLVVTGVGSASRYASVTMEDVVRVYADQVEPFLADLPVTPGERFANLEIQVPREPLVFFDTETDERGIAWASPVQTYLEMMQGDARLQESATTLRIRLIEDVRRQREQSL